MQEACRIHSRHGSDKARPVDLRHIPRDNRVLDRWQAGRVKIRESRTQSAVDLCNYDTCADQTHSNDDV